MFKSYKDLRNILDSKGQIFSIDALFALIIITIIVGMSANAMDSTVFKISDQAAGKSLDRIAMDAADVLINTPGSPDWDKNNITSGITPGLAQDTDESTNTTKVLSLTKILQLKTNYDELMSNIIPWGWSSSVTIYPVDPDLETIVVGNETPSSDVSELAVVNRTVLVNFHKFRILICINKYSPSNICPHNNYIGFKSHEKPGYNDNSPVWSCGCFKVTQDDLNTTDFYILTDPSTPNDNQARWILDRPDEMSEEQQIFQVQPISVNDKICAILDGDKEAVIWLHVLNSPVKSFDTYLVGVPKGTSYEEVRVEYLHPSPCFFVIKVWLQ